MIAHVAGDGVELTTSGLCHLRATNCVIAASITYHRQHPNVVRSTAMTIAPCRQETKAAPQVG